VAAILASRGDIEVLGHASTGEDAFALIEKSEPDLVITQIDVQLKEAKEVLSGIRSVSPDSRIVVLTMFDNLHYVQALAKLGVNAYLHKSSSSEELLATIDALGRDPDGDNVIISMPRDFLARMSEGPAGMLSERETEVLVLAARDFSNRQLSAEMQISEDTVKRHLANVQAKMAVSSRSGAVRKALAEQWIGIQDITAAADGSSRDGSSGA
jgi:DNA-binding NarL/FixJ family response regulator